MSITFCVLGALLLQEINVHTQEYCDRNVIIKILMTSVDRDFHEEKVKQLGQLISDAHFSISADTHSLTTDMHAAMKCMQEAICRETPYQVSFALQCNNILH